MKTSRFVVDVSYGQLCLFDAALPAPFNDWTERQHAQGFSWRPASVSFVTLNPAGSHEITLHVDEPVPRLPDEMVRAFRVPLTLKSRYLEIGSIGDAATFEIGPGEFCLQIEWYAPDDDDRAAVTVRLNRGGKPARVLRAGDGLEITDGLDLQAEPAG